MAKKKQSDIDKLINGSKKQDKEPELFPDIDNESSKESGKEPEGSEVNRGDTPNQEDDNFDVVCELCGEETGPGLHGGCDRSAEPGCTWHIHSKADEEPEEEPEEESDEEPEEESDEEPNLQSPELKREKYKRELIVELNDKEFIEMTQAINSVLQTEQGKKLNCRLKVIVTNKQAIIYQGPISNTWARLKANGNHQVYRHSLKKLLQESEKTAKYFKHL